MKDLLAVCILGAVVICTHANVLDHPVPEGYYAIEGDCWGQDIQSVTTANEKECSEKCNSRGDCVGFVFTYLTSVTYNCYLKKAMCNKPTALDKTTVYYKGEEAGGAPDGYFAMEGDCAGQDIKGVNTQNEEGCSAECNKLADCKGFVFTYLTYPTHNCYLKHTVCGLPSKLDVTTMYYRGDTTAVTPKIPEGYYAIEGDCWGQDIETVTTANEKECSEKCNSRGDCVGFVFTYLTSVTYNCYPKKAICNKPTALDKTTVYYKTEKCTENEAPEGYLPMEGDCVGQDIKEVDTQNEEECSVECNKLEACKGFVFTYLTSPAHNCFLKDIVCGLPSELDKTTMYYKVEKTETASDTQDSTTLPSADHPADAKEFDEYDTPDNFGYEDVVYEKKEGMDYIEFEVKANNDARILLLSDKSNTDTGLYELIIGAGGNSYTCLRKVKGGTCVAAEWGSHLDSENFKPFVVEFVDNRISVFEGYPEEKTTLMEFIDDAPTPINYLMISTGWGSTGKWKIGRF